MIFWPFKRRRSRRAIKHGPQSRQQPLSERTLSSQPTSHDQAAKVANLPVRRSSRRDSWRSRRLSQRQEKAVEAQWIEGAQRPVATGKENIPQRPQRPHDSVENITALPVSRPLQSSPHLRPVDFEKPPIPYNFRPHSASQTSVQWQEPKHKSRPHTLNSKRSTVDNAILSRKTSKASTKSRRRDDVLREEQIRAMSEALPLPKRPGDGPLRRDSKKLRGPGTRGSTVSLPPEGSIHSTMSGVIEQRGWEVGGLAMFNPRPAVRLSGTPQYIAPGTLAPSTGFLYRIDSVRSKEKSTKNAESKRRTVGKEADDLDASDIRAIMERDAKRRSKRQQERHEKLERKLQSRASRTDGDGERGQLNQVERDELHAELARLRAEQQGRRDGEAPEPPTAVHPALRDQPPAADSQPAGAVATGEERAAKTPVEAAPQNPFTDAAGEPTVSPRASRPFITPLETPVEVPALEESHDAPLPQTQTPPISPLRSPISSTSDTRLSKAYRDAGSRRSRRAPAAEKLESPTADSPSEKKTGAFASFFRRGGTNSRRSVVESKSPTSETSFSNISRESMKNQQLPPHLIDTQIRRTSTTSAIRSNSGTPVRSQSKFREDLPDFPISPPDSRTQSPDVTTMAAAAATARRAKRAKTTTESGSNTAEAAASRSDTPVGPPVRGHGLMSDSLASVDSEASWLASGANSHKRQSNQSALSRSLSKRTAEYSGSYEDLGETTGGDKDAEYLQRNTQGRVGSPLPPGPDEESVLEAAAATEDPLTVHGSVRRKPTLVHRDPNVKSREGLLAEFESAEPGTPAEPAAGGKDSPPDSDEFDQELQLQKAVSVRTVDRRHSRQFSAGSARLLDIANKRQSTDSAAAPAETTGKD